LSTDNFIIANLSTLSTQRCLIKLTGRITFSIIKRSDLNLTKNEQ